MQAPPMEAERRRPQRRRRRPSAAGGRLEKLHLDCASSAHSHYGNTQQWPLLHRKDCLQGSEIPAVILSPSRLVPIIAASPAREPMATARLGQMVTLSPRRLVEHWQPLRESARCRPRAHHRVTVRALYRDSDRCTRNRDAGAPPPAHWQAA
jgi:hypothetical protein